MKTQSYLFIIALLCVQFSFSENKDSIIDEYISAELFRNSSSIGSAQNINCTNTEAEIIATGTPSITINGSNYYAGFRQVTVNVRNPIVVKFTGGVQDWCREDYDTTTVDVESYGLFWTGTQLYALFTISGNPGSGPTTITRFTSNGFTPFYGFGGGPSVTVLLDINTLNGEGNFGTFLISRLSNNNTNFFRVKDIFLDNSNIVVRADTGFSPLDTDGSTRLTCSGSSPIDYTIILAPDLESASCASAVDCTNQSGLNCLNTLGLNTLKVNRVSLFYNTDTNSISVQGHLNDNTTIDIYNLSGQLVKQFQITKENPPTELILNHLEDGIYIAKMMHLNQTLTKKLIFLNK